jgi:molecular chaperone GrpE
MMRVKKREDKEKIREDEETEQIMKKEEPQPEQLPELEAARKECAENYDKYLRLAAEFENYKKRVQKDRTELLNYGNEKLLRDILPVMDALERALNLSEDTENTFFQGLKLIKEQLQSVLEKNGITAIDSVGRTFDPNIHEAMLQIDSAEHNQNEIVEEFEKGYLLNGRLLRPAKVSVARQVQ